MAFFDDVAKKVSDVAHTVSSKGHDIADITKLNFRISEEERKLDEIYKKIGKLFVERAGDKAKGTFAEMIDEIKEKEKEIEAYKGQIRDLKGIRLCENCGAELCANSTYCSTCGEKITTD